MTNILIIGKNGQVGQALPSALAHLGTVTVLDRQALDLTDEHALRQTIRSYQPQIIVNAAAFTAVDRAEDRPDLAYQINATAPAIMAQMAQESDALLVHYSTDYVFDGDKSTPYVETDQPNPLNIYGLSKYAGELAIQNSGATHYILRTSWVYADQGSNFLNTIRRLSSERPELRIVNDQLGAPTWAQAIAEMTASLLTADQQEPRPERRGLYHFSASGAVTWHGFAQAILAATTLPSGQSLPTLTPITTAEYPLPAMRPMNSRLDTSRLLQQFGIQPEPWDVMLKRCLRQTRSA